MISDCVIAVTGEKQVYDIETVLFRYGVCWSGEEIGDRYNPICNPQDKAYLYIRDGVISYSSDNTDPCMDLYSFKKFMDKYNNGDKMSEDIEDCTVLIQNAEELYEFENFASQKGIKWRSGQTHLDFDEPVMAIDIDMDDMDLVYGCRKDKDKADSDEYTYAEFMRKYKKGHKTTKINTKYTKLNDSLYRRKRVNLDQNN